MRILIRGGTIVDGTGAQPYKADILIDRDRIQAIGQFADQDNCRIIDATGLMVTPGFFDCHTHSELRLMHNRQHPNCLYQGVSGVMTGMCGLGFAPMKKDQWDSSIRMNAGIFENHSNQLCRWSSFSEWMDLLDGCGVNVASLATHNAIRQYACGFDDVPLTGDALTKACEALDLALSEGASGFSVGLSYYPGTFSDTQELIELNRIVAKHNAVFCVHLRLNTIGPEFHPMDEIAHVVEETGVRLHMLHHRTKSPTTIGHPEMITAPFENIIRTGAKVTFEYYPYLAGAGYMPVLLPGWIQAGGPDKILDRLKDSQLRERILKDISERYPLIVSSGTTGVITHVKDPYSDDIGKTFEQLADERGMTIPEMIVDLLIDNELEVGWHGTEPEDESIRAQLFDDQFALLSMPNYTIGSDTILAGDYCHPRAFGTYPRVIAFARDRGMDPATIIRKITALPADIYDLKDRGLLKPGYFADICAFDWDKITDCATFAEPRKAPAGVSLLIVNGRIALDEGHVTGILAGNALRREG